MPRAALLLLLALLPAAAAAADSPAERARQVVGASGYQVEIPDIEELAAEACEVTGASGGNAASSDGGRRAAATAPSSPGPGRRGATTAAVFRGLAMLMLVIFALALLLMLFQLVDRRRANATGGGLGVTPARRSEAELPPIEEAERLAAAGEHAAAAHLLLLHALRLLTRRAGARLAPSQTSREVLRVLRLEADDRERIEVLVGAVERSLFGGRALDRGDYEACRSAFDLFAEAAGRA